MNEKGIESDDEEENLLMSDEGKKTRNDPLAEVHPFVGFQLRHIQFTIFSLNLFFFGFS